MEAAELLEHAADLIEHVGIRKGLAWRGSVYGAQGYPGGPVCTYGALRLAALELNTQHCIDEAVAATLRHLDLRDQLRRPNSALAAWNDRPATSTGDAVDALRHAAKDLRNTDLVPVSDR